MNRVSLVGRTTKEIELRHTKSGKAVASFNLAVSRPREKDKADFIPCVAWGQLAEIIGKYVRKGDRIGLCGRIQSRSYEKDGKTVYTLEAVIDEMEFLQDKKSPEVDTYELVGDDADLPF